MHTKVYKKEIKIMANFWDSEVWSILFVVGTLLISLLVGNVVKKEIPFLKKSLIPTSVIAGLILIGIAAIYKACTGKVMFDTEFFGGNGTETLEIITYHSLALGFIASSLKHTGTKLTKQRTTEIINTGVTTVSTYLIQGVLGMAVTLIAVFVINGFTAGYSGILLPFGFGQGTGQAMNWGGIYEAEHGFDGGKSFGLTIAALGFLSASIGGVIHLNIAKARGKLIVRGDKNALNSEEVEALDEIPMQESMDKMTVQLSFIALAYFLSYVVMELLSSAFEGLRSTIFGFNFLLGVLMATLLKGLLKLGKKCGVVKKKYTNNFLLTRASNMFFDVMVVAGIAAIRLDILERYWGLMVILGVVGLIITYVYNRLVAKLLFKDYYNEQFLAMYGMLTGTASTGIILLREVDGNFETPAAANLVYQNFPAIVLGFPMMILATLAPKKPVLTLIILAVFFIVLQVFLFRSFIFKKRATVEKTEEQ